MKPCGCKFCNDLRYIEPASYVGYSKDASQEFKDFIDKAREEKKFLYHPDKRICVVEKCPMCGYVFTEEDYDSYTF